MSFVQPTNPVCICQKVKIKFEALHPFCELQIFSDLAQMNTHPLLSFIHDYTQQEQYTETFSLWYSQQVNQQKSLGFECQYVER